MSINVQYSVQFNNYEGEYLLLASSLLDTSTNHSTAHTAALAPESPSDQIDSLQASKTLDESSHYRSAVSALSN